MVGAEDSVCAFDGHQRGDNIGRITLAGIILQQPGFRGVQLLGESLHLVTQ